MIVYLTTDICHVQAYNYIADLPKRLPIRIAYKCLLDTWSEKVSRIPTGGHFHFDFHEEELEQYIL